MKRPLFLTILLLLYSLMGIVTNISIIIKLDLLQSANFPSWFIWFGIISEIAALVSYYLIWTWKKMGFYLKTVLTLISVLLSFYTGVFIGLIGIVLLALLYFAMRPVWSKFK